MIEKRIVQVLVGVGVLSWTLATPRTAWASISQGVNGPGEGEVAVESISVGTNVTSSEPITEAKVTIGGVTTPLSPVGPGYGAVVPLAGLPEGPLTAVVTVTNALGESVSTTRTFIHDKRPTIAVTAPKPWLFRSSPTSVRVTVSCADTALYPCDHITVPGLGDVPGASVDQDVAVPPSATSLTIDVVDTLGVKSSATVPLAYDATPTLSALYTVPGRALDADATRILYTNASGLWIRDIATGAETRAGDDVGDAGTGALTLTGAVGDERWVSGNRRFYVSGIAKSAVSHGERPTVTDALAGTSVTCGFNERPYDPIASVVGLSDTGVPHWLTAPYVLNGLASWQCSPSRFAVLSPTDSQHDAITSGGVYVYARSNSLTGDVAAIVCVRENGSSAPCGVLAPPVGLAAAPTWMDGNGRRLGRARLDFDTSCGWTAFTKLVGSQLQAFIQSPSGVVTGRGPTSVSTLGGIAPNGELIVTSSGTQYLTREGQPTVTFSTTHTRAKWVEGRWLGFSGGAILASSESLPGGPAYCASPAGAPDGGAPDAGASPDASAPSSDAGASDATPDASASDAGAIAKPDAAPSSDGAPSPSGPTGGPSGSGSGSGGAGSASGGSSSSGGGAPSDDPGGCSTASGGGTGAGVVGALAVFGLLLHRRRVRRGRRAPPRR